MSGEDNKANFDLFYLKSRDQIIDSFPESIKNDKQKIQDELDFYPEKLRPFMGLTLSGKPVSWRYKGNNTDIFDILLVLQVPGRSDIPKEQVVFTMKNTWFDAMSEDHKIILKTMSDNGVMGVFVPEPEIIPVEPEQDIDNEEEEETEDFSGFEERCMLYLKTVKDMGITDENFKEGKFTGSQYYPEELRPFAGAVLSATIGEWFEEMEATNPDGSSKMQRNNRMLFHIEGKTITIDIPVPEDIDHDAPGILLFDYKNWISMFADIIEASGPVLSDLIEAMKYLESIGAKFENTKEVTEVKEEIFPGYNPKEGFVDVHCSDDGIHVTKSKEYGMEFLAILMGPKELGITEENFYCKSFKNADMYPNDIIHMAGTIVQVIHITDDLCIVVADKKQYDISPMFIMPVDEVKPEAGEVDPWEELSIFDKDSIGKEIVAGSVDEFMFVQYPEVSARVRVRSSLASASDLIKLLRGLVHISRLTLSLLDKGIKSDFIIITDFIKGVSSMKLPVSLLDNLMFFQIDDKMEIHIVAYEDGHQGPGDKVDLSYADSTPEDLYLMELSDEFEADMNSGSGIRRLVLDQYPHASIIELRRI